MSARRATPARAPDDIAEMLLHVAVYAGVPAANSAVRLAKETPQGDGYPIMSDPIPFRPPVPGTQPDIRLAEIRQHA